MEEKLRSIRESKSETRDRSSKKSFEGDEGSDAAVVAETEGEEAEDIEVDLQVT